MTAATASASGLASSATPRTRPGDILRIVRLHFVNPSILVGVPWIILGGAWAVSMVLTLIIVGAGGPVEQVTKGMQYSWAVLSPQWYLVVVGVQAIAFTFQFALGFGATRRDYWLGTMLTFVGVSLFNSIAIATLVIIERATNGWGIGTAMFNALWYVEADWPTAFVTTFALQLFVLVVGAAVTTLYMRWRVRGMLVLAAVAIVLVLGLIATLTFGGAWAAVFEWFAAIGLVGGFGLLLGLAVVMALFGYVVVRRATPR